MSSLEISKTAIFTHKWLIFLFCGHQDIKKLQYTCFIKKAVVLVLKQSYIP